MHFLLDDLSDINYFLTSYTSSTYVVFFAKRFPTGVIAPTSQYFDNNINLNKQIPYYQSMLTEYKENLHTKRQQS